MIRKTLSAFLWLCVAGGSVFFHAPCALSAENSLPETRSAQENKWRDSRAVEEMFSHSRVQGTFVIYDAQSHVYTGYNSTRAAEGFVPGDTFRVPNALIALEIGLVKNTKQVLAYSGETGGNTDMTMSIREAFSRPGVPVYLGVSKTAGLERMREFLQSFNYGNTDTGSAMDEFWLKGPLKVSAKEQCFFLSRLALGLLPISSGSQEQVRGVMRLEGGENWELYAKIGTAASCSPPLGWWVGWVKREGRVYAFALNMDMLTEDDMQVEKRIALGTSCLRSLGVLPM